MQCNAVFLHAVSKFSMSPPVLSHLLLLAVSAWILRRAAGNLAQSLRHTPGLNAAADDWRCGSGGLVYPVRRCMGPT